MLADIHHRSPVILAGEQRGQWLASDYNEGSPLLEVYQKGLEKYAVDPKVVNNARNKAADCLVRM